MGQAAFGGVTRRGRRRDLATGEAGHAVIRADPQGTAAILGDETDVVVNQTVVGGEKIDPILDETPQAPGRPDPDVALAVFVKGLDLGVHLRRHGEDRPRLRLAARQLEGADPQAAGAVVE